MPRSNNVTRERDRDNERRAESRRLLEHPEGWQNLVLPMFKRTYTDPFHSKQIGVALPPIVCRSWRIYPDVNIFNQSIDWDRAKFIEYPTIDAILADGWLAD